MFFCKDFRKKTSLENSLKDEELLTSARKLGQTKSRFRNSKMEVRTKPIGSGSHDISSPTSHLTRSFLPDHRI